MYSVTSWRTNLSRILDGVDRNDINMCEVEAVAGLLMS